MLSMQSQKLFLDVLLLSRFEDVPDVVPSKSIIVVILAIWLMDLDDPCHSTLIIPTDPRPILHNDYGTNLL